MFSSCASVMTSGARGTVGWSGEQSQSLPFLTTEKCLGTQDSPEASLRFRDSLCFSSTAFFASLARSQSLFSIFSLTSLHTIADSLSITSFRFFTVGGLSPEILSLALYITSPSPVFRFLADIVLKHYEMLMMFLESCNDSLIHILLTCPNGQRCHRAYLRRKSERSFLWLIYCCCLWIFRWMNQISSVVRLRDQSLDTLSWFSRSSELQEQVRISQQVLVGPSRKSLSYSEASLSFCPLPQRLCKHLVNHEYTHKLDLELDFKAKTWCFRLRKYIS